MGFRAHVVHLAVSTSPPRTTKNDDDASLTGSDAAYYLRSSRLLEFSHSILISRNGFISSCAAVRLLGEVFLIFISFFIELENKNIGGNFLVGAFGVVGCMQCFYQ